MQHVQDQDRNGFTLIELMIVVAIMGLISGIGFVSLQSGRESLALDRAVHHVAQDMRKAMEYALRTRSYTCSIGSFSGYGVYISTVTATSYILFAECQGNEKYNPNDEDIEVVPLEKGVRFDSILVDGTSRAGVAISFFPPDPTVTIRGDTGPAGSGGVITLEAEDDPAKQRTITINEKGVVTLD